MTHSCPICYNSFDTEQGLKIHHTKTHDFKLYELADKEQTLQQTPVTENTFIDQFIQVADLRIHKGNELLNEWTD